MLVFAVETSCDETSVCILNDNKKIYSHIVYSQSEHKKYGGVIPELASRSHLQILQEITKDSLKEAKIDIKNIDLFCATCGPGLVGGLLVGSTFAKSLALGLKKPFMPINHLEGHLLSTTFNNNIELPFVSILLTGGHTQIYLVKSVNEYVLLGETLDDAMGEAFDKVAKLLEMPYPGGPEIEKAALYGNENRFDFPHPLYNKKDLNFSFSGIKTAASLIIKKQKINNKLKCDVAASFQKIISEIIEKKIIMTFEYLKKNKINISYLSVVGGVAKNKFIINKIKEILINYNCRLILPIEEMLTDNAAMIGWACIQKYHKKPFSDLNFKVNPRLNIETKLL